MRKYSHFFLYAFFSSLIFSALISAGIGVFFPAIIVETSDFIVCSNGQVSFDSQEYRYKPGQRGIELGFFCLEENGESRDVTFSSAFVSIGVLFVITFIISHGFWLHFRKK